jgi:hypothetical protein
VRVATTSAVLRLAAPRSDGGARILGYEVTTNAGRTWSHAAVAGLASSSPRITVRGLRPGTAYAFRVRARNAAGVGSASSVVRTRTR